MPSLPSLFRLSLLTSLFVSIAVGSSKLRHIQMFFRHGQRTPTTFLNFPNENISSFPGTELAFDLGEMTTEGMWQEFVLGQKVRSLYGQFLGESYRSREICALSGRDNRTIASAQLMLAGLYPPRGDQIWNRHLLWQPIPVETVPILDHVSFGMFDDCAAESDRVKKSEEYARIGKRFELLTEELSENTGLDIPNLEILQKVIDAIVTRSNLFAFLPLPKWASSDAYIAKMVEERLQLHQQLIDIFLEPIGGWHFDQLIGRMDDAANNRSRQKAAFYSAHDTNILSLGRYLNISPVNDMFFPYAGFVVFELYQDNDGQHFVEVKSHPQLNGTLSRLDIPDCAHPCPLSRFRTIRSRTTTVQWMSICSGTSRDECSVCGSVSGVLTVLMVLLLALLCSLLWSCRSYKRRCEQLMEEKEPLLAGGKRKVSP
uniref:Acid phosphatase n=1 Tax=Globodera rostochiensis TaxID=31243 RepID=A0A914HV89_GLORO